jgi:predicted nucleic-acid-binding protein
MIALDTNVLVRYLAQDDTRQSALATRLLEQRLSAKDPGFVSLVTLLETVWVMENCYGADAARVAAILTDLLDTAALTVQEAPAVRTAVVVYCRGGVDLHDCLIVSLAESRNARVVTFDAKAARKLGMELLR